MKLAETYLDTLDANRDRIAHDAFTRLVREDTAPIHAADLRPLLTWLCEELDRLAALDTRVEEIAANVKQVLADRDERLAKLEQRQDPNFHNPKNGS